MSVKPYGTGKRKRWLVRWLDHGAGKHRGKVYDTKREADAWDRQMKDRAGMGAHAPALPSDMRLRDWVNVWTDQGAGSWARSTQVQRADVLQRCVEPYVYGLRLRDLGRERVQAWLADLSRDGHPPSQRNQALRVLSACLGEAVKQGKLPTNPCAGVRKAPQAPTSAQALTPDQVEAVRASMAPRDALVVSLMAYAGLRPEEVVALTWGDVGPVLVIDKAYTYGAPKTTKSGRRRTVEVVGPLAADLDAYRPAHAAPWHLVVQATRGGHLDWKNWTRRQWHDAATAAGVQAKPYDLRHTYCSLLINEGRSVLLVAAAMGHANSQLTLDTYSHLFDAAGPAHAVAMVDAVEAARAAAGTGLQTGCNARRRGHLRLVAAEG